MRNLQLSAEEIKKSYLAHKLGKPKSKTYRINAVIGLGAYWTVVQVFEVLLVDQNTLSNGIQQQKESGCSNLPKVLHQSNKESFNQAQILQFSEERDSKTDLTKLSICVSIEKRFRYIKLGARAH
jgi:hypothetical protein